MQDYLSTLYEEYYDTRANDQKKKEKEDVQNRRHAIQTIGWIVGTALVVALSIFAAFQLFTLATTKRVITLQRTPY